MKVQLLDYELKINNAPQKNSEWALVNCSYFNCSMSVRTKARDPYSNHVDLDQTEPTFNLLLTLSMMIAL